MYRFMYTSTHTALEYDEKFVFLGQCRGHVWIAVYMYAQIPMDKNAFPAHMTQTPIKQTISEGLMS